MTETSDDMVAAAKGSKATANSEASYESGHHIKHKSGWSAAASLNREKSATKNGSRRGRISLGLAVGGGLVVALLLLLTQRGGDAGTGTGGTPTTETSAPTTTTPTTVAPTTTAPATTTPSTAGDPSTPAALTETCGGEPCAALLVEGTLETPGEGVWIRSCFDNSPCERQALAAEGQQIHGVCRVDTGKDVFGNTVWVKTPWAFTGPIPQDQPVRAESTGHSDPNSQEYGWATAYYLTPTAAIDALPVCTT